MPPDHARALKYDVCSFLWLPRWEVLGEQKESLPGCFPMRLRKWEMVSAQFRREDMSPTALLSSTMGSSQDSSIAGPILPPEGLDVEPTAGTKTAMTWRMNK